MNKNLLAIGLVGLVFLASCGKDDEAPAPPHIIVGTWELDGVSFYNLPSAYNEYWEGLTFQAANFYGAETYEMEFFNDNTYELTVKLSGPDFNETGTWEIDGDQLILMPDDDDSGLEREYVIEEDITETSLQISVFSDFPLITDEVMMQIEDTAQTNNIWNYVLFDMDQETFDELSDEVAVYFRHNFEKNEE